jgi:predicted dehydrogenase
VHDAPRLRVGVIGCGLIAQSKHLPLLRELPERFDVEVLCDISPGALEFCGERWFPGARRVERWEDALGAPLDAVFVLTPGSHSPVAMAAAEAGLHVFVEKPVALSSAEGAAMCDAADAAGVCLMAGYMKRYDPAYEELQRRAAALDALRLVRVTTLEAPLEPYVAHYPMHRPRDVDPGLLAALTEDDDRRVVEAIGPEAAADPILHRAYRYVLLDCLVHEFNALRGVLGEPSEVSYAAASGEATGITTVLRFGAAECVQAWSELDALVRYGQELAFYSDAERLALSFPSPFLRNIPAQLVTEGGAPGEISTWRAEHTVSYEDAFQRELVEFHEAATAGREPRTPARDGVRDVALSEAWVRCAREGRPVANPTAVGAPA